MVQLKPARARVYFHLAERTASKAHKLLTGIGLAFGTRIIPNSVDYLLSGWGCGAAKPPRTPTWGGVEELAAPPHLPRRVT